MRSLHGVWFAKFQVEAVRVIVAGANAGCRRCNERDARPSDLERLRMTCHVLKR